MSLGLVLGCSGGPATKKAVSGAQSPAQSAPASSQPANAPAGAAGLMAAVAPARPEVQLGTVWVLRGGVVGNEIGEDDRAVYGDIVGGISGGGGSSAVVVLSGGSARVVPTVVLGTPTIRGALDRTVVHRALRRRLYSFRRCYQQQLRLKPQLRGTVWVRFTVQTSGRAAQIKASGMDKDVARCVQRYMRYVRFPKPTNGSQVQITYPFRFRSTAAGFSPMAHTQPPPVPKPQIQPAKPTLIPLTESPVFKRDAPAVETGAGRCKVAPRPVGAQAVVPAARICYEQLLDRKPAWIGRVELRIDLDATGTVSAAKAAGAHADAGLWKCLEQAGEMLVLSGPVADDLRGHSLVMLLSFHKQGGVPLPTTRVTATKHDLRVGVRLIASEVAWSRLSELTRIAWRAVYKQALITGGQTELRIDDQVDSGAVVGAVAAYGNVARSLRFARKLDSGRWKIVNPLGGRRLGGVCKAPAKGGRVSVRLDREAIWIGTKKGHVKIGLVNGKHDLLGYARALRALRRGELAERSDLELGVAIHGVPYGIFVRALEIAIETGFHDASVRPLRALRNPRTLPIRSF